MRSSLGISPSFSLYFFQQQSAGHHRAVISEASMTRKANNSHLILDFSRCFVFFVPLEKSESRLARVAKVVEISAFERELTFIFPAEVEFSPANRLISRAR